MSALFVANLSGKEVGNASSCYAEAAIEIMTCHAVMSRGIAKNQQPPNKGNLAGELF